MKIKRRKEITVPTLTFHSDYFMCPRCNWECPDRLLVKGDIIPDRACPRCGNSYLVRKK